MKGFFRFVFSGRVWKHIFLILVCIALIVWVTTLWLNAYTEHGESITVPDLSEYPVGKLDVVLGNLDLSYDVVDSIYSSTENRGVVVSQNPAAGMQVKRGRTVFITVNSVLPEMVAMPDLVGKSKRIALPLIEIAGLKLAALEYKPDESCTDCVLEQKYKGEPIAPGAKIRKGESITLELGKESNVPTVVPRVLGMEFNVAGENLNAFSLNVGTVMACEGCRTANDTARAFVINQKPGPGAQVRLGTYVDLYLTTDSAKLMPFLEPDDVSATAIDTNLTETPERPPPSEDDSDIP